MVPATACIVGGVPNPTLYISGDALPDGHVGVAYSAFVIPGPGTTGLITASGLPAGLAVSTGGLITGTPTTEGYYTVTFTITNATLAPTRTVKMRILP